MQLYKRIDKADGSILFSPVSIESLIGDNERMHEMYGCSARIKQAIMVVNEMRKSNDYAQAVKNVAKILDVTENSVRDKLERQMGQSADDVKDLIEQYLNGNQTPLKSQFRKFIGQHTRDNDIAAIEQHL